LVSGLSKMGYGFGRYATAKKAIGELPDYQQHRVAREVDHINSELERRYQNPFAFAEENMFRESQAMNAEAQRSGAGNTLSAMLSKGESTAQGMSGEAAQQGEATRRRGGYLAALANLSKTYQEAENKNVAGHNARTLETEIALGQALSQGQMDAIEGFGEYGDEVVDMATKQGSGFM